MSDQAETRRLKRLRKEAERADRLLMIGARAGIRARGDMERALAEPDSPFARGFRSELLRPAQHGEVVFPTVLAALGAQYGELLLAAQCRFEHVWEERYRAGYARGVEDGRKAAEREAA